MKNKVSPIELFLKKYRSAIANKNKDIRISIEEASDIVSAFASMNTDNSDLNKKLEEIKMEIKNLQENHQDPSNMDGGNF